MGEEVLVESLKEDALLLVDELDRLGCSPSFAAWYFYVDTNQWRLLLAMPALDGLLPKREPFAYQKIVSAIERLALRSLSISDIRLVRTDSPLSELVRLCIGKNEGAGYGRISHCYLNDIYVEEMYVMRSLQ